MRARRGVLLVAGLALMGADAAAAAPHRPERALLKDWALARCIAAAAKGQPIADDAAKSAAALLERSTSRLDIFERIDALATTYLARRYGGSVPANYDTLKCIDLYHSPELDRLVATAKRP